jgi:Mor family transcriptional regulator
MKDRKNILARILERVREIEPTITEDKLQTIEETIRLEYGGSEHYIPKETSAKRTNEIQKQFNGRNISEVAETLGISRRSVYRRIKRSSK